MALNRVLSHRKRHSRVINITTLILLLFLLLQSCSTQSICHDHNAKLTFDSLNDTYFAVPQNNDTESVEGIFNCSHPITLVSIYYPAAEKDLAYLNGFMKTYLRRIATPIVFFTSEDFRDRIQEMRGDLPILIVTRYSDPAQFGYISLLRSPDVFEQQAAQLYVRPDKNANNSKIWNAKPMITAMTAIVNPFHSKTFVYVDAGGIFGAVLPEDGGRIFWPDYGKIQRAVDRFDTEQLFMSAITKTWGDPTIPWFQGTWFAGTRSSIIHFANQFYDALQNISSRTFSESSILSDETTILEVIQSHPDQFSVLRNSLIPDGPHCGGTWRVFAHTLKSTSDQKENTNCVGRGYDELTFVPAAEVFASLKGGSRSYGSGTILKGMKMSLLSLTAGLVCRKRPTVRIISVSVLSLIALWEWIL